MRWAPYRFGPGVPQKGCTAPETRSHARTESASARCARFHLPHQNPAIFHLKDFHEPLRESPEIRRRLRDVYRKLPDRQKFVVITSPVRFIPEEIERSILFLELRPPDHGGTGWTSCAKSARGTERRNLAPNGARTAGPHPRRSPLCAAARAGERVAALGPESLPALLEEKRLLVNRSGMIEFIADGKPGRNRRPGGPQEMAAGAAASCFNCATAWTGEIVPKGLLMMGIPGCGKSLAVKAIASPFQLPLYRVDMIEIFSGRHGKPEGAFVEACKMMEDMAPAVLWFDEIEMGITSTDSGGEQGRIFAFFLTWMQEKTRGLFVAATANRIDLLPAEMIRKGRFDEVFFVDLPSDEERIEIFKIHLKRRGVDAAAFHLGATDAIHGRLDGRGNRAMRGVGDHQGAAGGSRTRRSTI